MRSLIWKVLLLLASALAAAGNAAAEDIDVYAGNSSGGNSNLLIVLDNSGSWNGNANTSQCPGVFSSSNLLGSAGGVQACGLWSAVNTIGSIPSLLGKLNMGVMLLGAQSTNGGVFKFPAVAAPSALVNMNATGISQMKTVLEGLSSSGASSDTSNGRDFGGSTWEAWAFYTGKTGASGTTYPGINTATCGKNFVIRVGIADNNAQPGDYNAGQVKTALSNAITSTSADPALLDYISPTWISNNKFSSATNFWGDEWTRYMKRIHDITTYTITLVDTGASDTQNVSAYKEYMKRTANVGGGKEFVVDINDMEAFVQALLAIFNEIQAVNSVFAAASLPISVNASGTFLNQIYMGMFRPDPTGLPRWAGNLKQYQFQLDTSDPLRRRLFMADSTGASAINAAGTGFFAPGAISFWTSKNTAVLPDSIDPDGSLGVNGATRGGFFIFNPQGTAEGFDLPDGEVVEKGGVAQQIRLENLTSNYATLPHTATNPRRLYTCTDGLATTCGANSSLSATPFDTTNTDIDTTLLGAGIPGTPITSIVLSGTTATVTLSSAMSPVLVTGETVTIAGSAYSRFNGQFVAGGPPTATSFTVPVTVLPPATATGTSYTASLPGTSQPVTSITRLNGTTARVNLPAHGLVSGQLVQIAGAGTGYDTSGAAITVVDGDNFNYAVTVGPAAGGGGTVIKVGDPVGNARTIDTIANGGIIVGAPASTFPFTAKVTLTTTNNLPNTIAVGSSITISGTSQTVLNATWVVTGLGNACDGSGSTQKRLCFDIDTTPAAAGTAGATASTLGSTIDVTQLTRTTACTGGTPTPASTVTATTSTTHSFLAGQKVTIAGSGSSDNALYLGNQEVLASPAPTATTFSYQITTDPPCSDTTGGMTASALGVTRDTLIRWVRGEDSRGDEDSPGSGITIRPSVHGDVLHSRPAVVDYGSTTGVVVFYGSNDGVFRAINGNQGDPADPTVGAIGTVPPGGELWGFIPTEFYSNLKRMYLNTPVIKLSSTSSAILPAPQPKNYFFDGGTGVFQDITSGTVYLFLSARRGGRLIYALDVTDPADPKFLWKRGCPNLNNNTGCDLGFAELGQTWSQPKVALVKGYANPVLIFGAGYDTGEDAEPPAAATMGRGIFILDATTGNIVWQAVGDPTGSSDCVGTPCKLADMTYAIPSDVTLIDREITDVSGFIDRLYVPDLGGNIWRVDLEPAAGNTPDKWQVTKFASVGGTGATKRKLFFPPDVVLTKTFDAVLISTGDREHPTLDQASVNIVNRFYMLKDTTVASDACPIIGSPGVRTCQATIVDSTSSTADDPPADLFNASFILPSSASSTPTSPGPAYDQTGKGFYITLRNAVATKNPDGSTTYGPGIETGEKAVNAPTTVGGFTFFGTNTPIPPDPSVCQPNLGTARGYRVNFITGEAKFVVFAGGGLPPSPVAGVVNVGGVDVPFLIGGGNPDPTCVGPDCLSSVGGQEPPIPITPIRSRVFWYRDLGNR